MIVQSCPLLDAQTGASPTCSGRIVASQSISSMSLCKMARRSKSCCALTTCNGERSPSSGILLSMRFPRCGCLHCPHCRLLIGRLCERCATRIEVLEVFAEIDQVGCVTLQLGDHFVLRRIEIFANTYCADASLRHLTLLYHGCYSMPTSDLRAARWMSSDCAMRARSSA